MADKYSLVGLDRSGNPKDFGEFDTVMEALAEYSALASMDLITEPVIERDGKPIELTIDPDLGIVERK